MTTFFCMFRHVPVILTLLLHLITMGGGGALILFGRDSAGRRKNGASGNKQSQVPVE